MEYSIIKRLSLAILLLAVAGCSSSSKDDSTDSSLDKKSTQDKSSAKSHKHKAEAKPEAAAASLQELNRNLSEAVKARDDEDVYRAATGILAQSPNDLMALNSMGLFHLHKGRPLAAKLFFGKVLQQKPGSAEAHSNMGLVHLAMKENKEAIKSFKKAVELDSNSVAAGLNLSSLYLAQRDFNKAYAVLSIVASKAPRDLTFLNNMAVASAEYGKLDEAEKYYREALQLAPSNKEVLYNYAVFQIDYLKKFKPGLETLDRLKFLGLGENMRNNTNALENRAKAGLK